MKKLSGIIGLILMLGALLACGESTATTTLIPTHTNPTSVPTKKPVQMPAAMPTHAPVQPTALPPTPKPQAAAPTQSPAPTSPPVHLGVNGNPWGYTFALGTLISNPPTDFCAYFACITTFWKGNGYVEECQDTMFSLSGGLSGSCSRHGGNLRPLYSH